MLMMIDWFINFEGLLNYYLATTTKVVVATWVKLMVDVDLVLPGLVCSATT